MTTAGVNMDNHNNKEEAMETRLDFDPEAAAIARRSWEDASPEQEAAMLAGERKLYRQERARRSALAGYITHIREELKGRAVMPWSLTATAAVVRVADVLGAIFVATDTGKPRVLVDNNSVTYHAERWTSPDNVELHADPVVDPLLEDLAAALGCRWTWVGDEAIELEATEELPLSDIELLILEER